MSSTMLFIFLFANVFSSSVAANLQSAGDGTMMTDVEIGARGHVVHPHHGHHHHHHHPEGHHDVAELTGPFRQQTNGSTPAGWIQLGTPKKWLFVIFDTGSDKLVAKTWESVEAELASVDQGIQGMYLPSPLIYNHNSSSSYHKKYIQNPLTHQMEAQQSAITYGSGTAITDVGDEDVKVGGRTLNNFTLMEITADSLQLLHTSKGIAGILGLQHMKNQSLGHSLFSRLRDAGKLTSFGYCRGDGNNGTFIWADDSDEGTELEVIGQMHWAVKLGNLKVNTSASPGSLLSKKGKRKLSSWPFDASSDDASTSQDDSMASQEGSPDDEFEGSQDAIAESERVLQSTCPNNGCTAILDTGSNIIAGPTDVMKSLTNLVNVKPDCSNFDSLPNINMVFGGQAVTVTPSGYVMKVPMPSGGLGGEGGGQGDAQTSRDGGEGQGGAGLAEESAGSTAKRWTAVFDQLHKDYGVDMRDMVREILKMQNTTSPNFLCMPALVPLDKHTAYGPLFVVGTPLLETTYARWSWAKNDDAPKVHIKPLSEAKVCKEGPSTTPSESAVPAGLMRAQKDNKELEARMASLRMRGRGPRVRKPEDISFPHWAKDLLHI